MIYWKRLKIELGFRLCAGGGNYYLQWGVLEDW